MEVVKVDKALSHGDKLTAIQKHAGINNRAFGCL